MLNKNERFEKLNNAGVDTSKYFTVDLDNGTKIHLIIDENGCCKQVKDPIVNQIIEDGYVKNTKLHRRFVMAQMFQMLNYKSYDGKYEGYNACLRRNYGYGYTFKMMTEEARVLSKLEVRDKESFDERSHFFTRNVIADVIGDYMNELEKYVDGLPMKKCKGVPYKRIKGINIFVSDLHKKLYSPLSGIVYDVLLAKNYTEIYKALCKFNRIMVKLPYDTPKSKTWIDAYKGEGAYYTMKNLVMYHDCDIIGEDVPMGAVRKIAALRYLNGKLDEYQGQGWRMFALMKKVIADNNFDFSKRMEEIYNK